MSETKTKNLCTVPAADLTDSQYFIAEDGGELKRIPKAQVVLKKLEKMLATDTENLAGGGEVTAQELLDALAEQVANKLLAKSQVVNNLLATVEGNPLDATQGKALKELIDTTNNNLSNTASLYGGTRIPAGSDMHTYLMPGNYYCGSYDDAISLTNCPVGNAFKMEVSAPIANKAGTYLLQKYITHDGKTTAIVAYDPYNQTWETINYATKDDLPNIYGVQFEKNNESPDHVQTIKNIWNKFPDNKPFVCTSKDANKYVIVGYIYDNKKYGAVLYLAYNSCGIVKCNGGTFSDTKL